MVLGLFSAFFRRLRDFCVRPLNGLLHTATFRFFSPFSKALSGTEVGDLLSVFRIQQPPVTNETRPADDSLTCRQGFCDVHHLGFGRTRTTSRDSHYRVFRLHSSHCVPARARRQPQTVPGPFLRSAKNISIALALLSAPAFGQSSGFIQIYQATAPGTSANFSNINPKYNAWTVMYNYSGSGSFSVELDCAPDATVAGGTPTPGSFAACTNTVTGSNPSSSPNYGYITFVGYTPWLQLHLTAISSGNMTAVAVGFLAADPEGASGGGGTAKQNCDPSTSTLTVTTATIALSASGLTQIIPATASHKVLVCSMGVSFASGVNFQLETGTGSNCGTGTTALTGTLQSITALSLDSTASILTPVSVAVCVNLGASVVGGGWVTYATD